MLIEQSDDSDCAAFHLQYCINSDLWHAVNTIKQFAGINNNRILMIDKLNSTDEDQRHIALEINSHN